VTDVSQRLLTHHGGLRGLFRPDVAELVRVPGINDADATRVKAVLELGQRLTVLSPEERPPVGSPEDVVNLLGIEMAALEQEQLRVVLLDAKHRILGTRTVYQGSVNQAQVRVPILLEHARPFIVAGGRVLTRSSHLHVGIDGWLRSEVAGARANGARDRRVPEGF
jgi:DNA repair protein RadC